MCSERMRRSSVRALLPIVLRECYGVTRLEPHPSHVPSCQTLREHALPHPQAFAYKSLFRNTLPVTHLNGILCRPLNESALYFEYFAARVEGEISLIPPRAVGEVVSPAGRERAAYVGRRLQKIIGAEGIRSRRKAEQLVAGGLVSVNDQTVKPLFRNTLPITPLNVIFCRPLKEFAVYFQYFAARVGGWGVPLIRPPAAGEVVSQALMAGAAHVG